jgi:cobalamin biosynthesis protein CobT
MSRRYHRYPVRVCSGDRQHRLERALYGADSAVSSRLQHRMLAHQRRSKRLSTSTTNNLLYQVHLLIIALDFQRPAHQELDSIC